MKLEDENGISTRKHFELKNGETTKTQVILPE